MKKIIVVPAIVLIAFCTYVMAQPPGGGRGPGGREGGRGGEGPGNVEEMVERLMAFDKNGDAKLARDELSESRLLPLFDRADTNRDGIASKEELATLFTNESRSNSGPGGGGPGGSGGPGAREGFGGPGGGRGGFGDRGGFQFGQVLPVFLQEELKLTESQKKEIEKLQATVDAQMAKILTAEQKEQLTQLAQRGPRGGRPGEGRGPGERGRPQ